MISVVSWIISDSSWFLFLIVPDGLDGFRLFQVVPDFSMYIDLLIRKLQVKSYPENSVGSGGLRK